MATGLQLIQNYTKKEDEGAARVRVLACGFILNLTNECGKSHSPTSPMSVVSHIAQSHQ